jgi:TM2 domain-containing membrane protein YozV
MYYLLINDQRTGPYSALDIKRMFDQRAIGLETQYWADGMLSWATIGSSRHLFDISAPTQPIYPPQNVQPQYGNFRQDPGQPQGQAMYQPIVVGAAKSRVSFILLGLFLGGLGIHNFYAGYNSKGITQLLLNLFLFWTIIVPIGIGIWVLIEVITVDHDANGFRMT